LPVVCMDMKIEKGVKAEDITKEGAVENVSA
jgi:hypothetical protein